MEEGTANIKGKETHSSAGIKSRIESMRMDGYQAVCPCLRFHSAGKRPIIKVNIFKSNSQEQHPVHL